MPLSDIETVKNGIETIKLRGPTTVSNNIVISNHNPTISSSGPVYIKVTPPGPVDGEWPEAWLQINNQTMQTEIKLSDKWVKLNVLSLIKKHPLDFGNGLETKGSEDLTGIIEQYEKHIKSSPWLQKLRNDYNKLLKKNELFDAIKGDNDAEI